MANILLPRQTSWGIEAPPPQSRLQNWPTILFSWWATSFAATIIITRVVGRKIRSNVLFREDWIMLFAMIPLFARMILVHFILIYGTNNVQTEGYTYTPEEIRRMELGSKLVLAARILYALYIWLCKLTVSEFLKRITIRIWRRQYELVLMGIRLFLGFTLITVVIASLTSCRPYVDLWQVIPAPDPNCRLAYTQLLTMGTCDITTDILLIVFPIPIVMRSGQSWRTKLQVSLFFSLSIFLVAITATRIPMVMIHHGLQQYRSLWASCEILAAAAVSNAVILGSFVRDKGTKKNRYKTHSQDDSQDPRSSLRPTVLSIESDEDLFQSLGYRIPNDLQERHEMSVRPAPPGRPAGGRSKSHAAPSPTATSPMDSYDEESATGFAAGLTRELNETFVASSDPARAPVIPRVLPSASDTSSRGSSNADSTRLPFMEDFHVIPSLSSSARTSSVLAHDWASASSSNPSRHSSRALSHDVHAGPSRRYDVLRGKPMVERRETEPALPEVGESPEPSTGLPSGDESADKVAIANAMAFQDVGGLLSGSRPADQPRAPAPGRSSASRRDSPARHNTEPINGPTRSRPSFLQHQSHSSRRNSPVPRRLIHPEELQDVGGLLSPQRSQSPAAPSAPTGSKKAPQAAPAKPPVTAQPSKKSPAHHQHNKSQDPQGSHLATPRDPHRPPKSHAIDTKMKSHHSPSNALSPEDMVFNDAGGLIDEPHASTTDLAHSVSHSPSKPHADAGGALGALFHKAHGTIHPPKPTPAAAPTPQKPLGPEDMVFSDEGGLMDN